jgi:hypothetical protein
VECLSVRLASLTAERGEIAMGSRTTSLNIVFRVTVFSIVVGLGVSWCHFYRSSANSTVPQVPGFDNGSGAKKNVAELPHTYLDTTYVAPKGKTIIVPAGGNLQEAINRAQCGDVVKLASGARFLGNFQLTNKGECKEWIVIQSDAPASSLPVPGSRITPSYVNVMPKIFSNNVDPALTAPSRANHYRLIGLEIGVTDEVKLSYGIFTAGLSEVSLSELPHDITIDRCYIHGTPNANIKRGVTFNGASLAVVDSYISDIHVVGQDTQAIEGWNGPGPFKIVDNELEAAGENVMFGGARPALVGNIPSDIEIRGNHFFKPLSWMVGNPSYAGNHWSVKNLLEFKIAQRVLVTGNILENNWGDAQNGFAFLVTPRTEDGKAPWVYVQDITFTYNVLRHTGSGVNISGQDSGDPQKVVRGRRILIQNNLFEDINGKSWGGDGRLFQLLAGADAVTIDHNTGFQSNQIIYADGRANTNFVYQNNITPHNIYGVMGSGAASGNSTLAHFFPGFAFQKNVIEGLAASGLSQSGYPAGNFFPPDWAAVKFTDMAKGNYALSPSSKYKKAGTDGKDIGADIAALNAATSSVIVP